MRYLQRRKEVAMKQLLLMIAVVALVGCGEDEASDPENPEKGYVHHATVAGKIEWVVRKATKKPTGELTKEDYEKVRRLVVSSLFDGKLPKDLEKLTKLEELYLSRNQLTNVKGLEKLTQLKELDLRRNQLTDLKGLENLTKLNGLHLSNNPDLTKAQINQLKKTLPKCLIGSNPTK